jgi:hypothetical protein
MEQSTRFVGMDVHKDTIVVAVTATGEVGVDGCLNPRESGARHLTA